MQSDEASHASRVEFNRRKIFQLPDGCAYIEDRRAGFATMKTRAQVEQAADFQRVRANQLQPPIDPLKIAEVLEAKVVLKEFSEDIAGILVREGPSAMIAVNAADGALRQRFTVAHECGHLALHHVGEFFVDRKVINRRDSASGLAIDDQEIEANQFAASLLMPRERVVEHLAIFSQHYKSHAVLVDMMAGKFHVSRSAMEFRLVNLGLLAAPDD